jgi:hypothetical protein
MCYQSPTTCLLRNNTYWRTYELLDGFSNGFKIKYSGPRLALETKNLKSVFINPTVALQKVENEIHLGRIAEPLLEGIYQCNN